MLHSRKKQLIESCRKTKVPKKILIIDDDRPLAELLGMLLKIFGYPEPRYAGDGAEGLFVMENDADIALIFTDREMPNMEGPEFIKQCRGKYWDKRIIYMSGTIGQDDDLTTIAKEVGADAAIPKPFLPHRLLDALTIAGMSPRLFQ